MARNFAQIAFLIYAILMTRTAHRAILLLLSKKIGRRAVARRTNGLYHAASLDQVKKYVPQGLWLLNAVTLSLLAASSVYHLLLGWVDGIAVFGKILNSMALLSAAFLATAGSLLNGVLRYGEMLYLYQKNDDPESMQAFSSSLLDAVLYLILPVLMIVCNFTL